MDPGPLVAGLIHRDRTRALVELPGRPPLSLRLPLLVLGAGKAAARMALGCSTAVGADQVHGAVIVNDGAAVELPTIDVHAASHPLPDQRGMEATARLLDLAAAPQAGDTLCLISGGASSLLVSPRPPITLQDKVHTTQLLLACGADISEINPVRKHLSLVKGGGLLRKLGRSTVTLAISDVIGDSESVIGSGPTVADPTTFAEAHAVFERYQLYDRLPDNVAALIKSGLAGREAETLKPSDSIARQSTFGVVASNRMALEAAAAAARQKGWRTIVEPAPLQGDTTQAAQSFGSRILQVQRENRSGSSLCVLAGGETTVLLRGNGHGGRNQEFALAMVDTLAGSDIVVLSGGTDGIDGPTDAAGALVDGGTHDLAIQRGIDPQTALADNDAYTFFDRLGGLIRIGPTGTNVMDVKIALLPPAAGSWP